ncbi:MAG: M23 family metallopeptidase [Bacteroidales bacterium]|nr:M23 family metallopeptidase [Bacteroidales bacterium]
MSKKLYVFDAAAMKVRKITRSVWTTVWSLVRVVLVSVSLFVVLYLILSLVLSTDTEKRLRRENRQYEKVFASIPEKQELLSGSIDVLALKDSRIYEEVFHTAAPPVDPIGSLNFLFGADTIPDTKIVTYTTRKADALMETASEVNAAFEKIYRTMGEKGFVMPPMSIPVKDVSYPQIGASTGSRLNPFYKTEVAHHGLDFIVPQGSPVYAPAEGTVEEVVRTSKGDGNTVTIRHTGGYVTRYLHLDEIFVSKGQRVRRGGRIATVGMSGNAYAPHLHYEVKFGGAFRDPVNYLFGSVSPDEYPNYLFMSINTRQSMD